MNNSYKIFTLKTLIVFLLTFPINETLFSQTTASQIDTLMHKLAEREEFEGSILVSENDKIIYQNGFGKADVKGNIDFKPSTPCYLASLSKQFTAMAVMILAEQKKLSYEDKLSKYFPEFPEYAQKVTVRNLLNHTSGIADYLQLGLEYQDLTNEEALTALIRLDSLHFPPGEKFEYSNSGYIILASIIEKVSNQSYPDFLKKNIFKPLGMNNTFVYKKPMKPEEKRARGYSRFGNDDDYILLTYGDGGIYSSVEDLFKWDQALYNCTLVRQSTLDEAFSPAKLNNGNMSNYGFGWGIGNYEGEPTVSHAGRFGGFNTYIKRLLTEHCAIIFLTNKGFKNNGAIGNAILNILHNKPYELPKLSIAELMYKKYLTLGADSAVQLYKTIKNNNDTNYDWSESELNELGYELLGKSAIQDAIEILKLNAEEFPGSWNVYDGLGEAFMKNGNKELAIKNYRQSLELNPENFNAVNMLIKLETSENH